MKQTMMQQALAARKNAYAPYSGFTVGAVLETEDGRRFCGCNVENSSYSMTICAERNAVFAAVSAGIHQFRRITIVGGKDDHQAAKTPCFPCGACLQVLAEFCPPDFPIELTDGIHTLQSLLPSQFRLTNDPAYPPDKQP